MTMFNPNATAPPMNFNDLFMAQNLGMQPQPPMSGAQSPFTSMQQAPQQPMAGPQNVPLPPEAQHLSDVINQYTQNQQSQTNNSGLVQQILSNRMQPTDQDNAQATSQTAQSILMPHVFQPLTPDAAMAQRYASQLAPYTQGLGLANQNAELSGRLMQNNITSQTGLPMAQAQLQREQMANDIMAKTGMSKAQAEITLQNAQAGALNGQLQREIDLKKFEYANDPSMQAAAGMNRLLYGGGATPTSNAPTGQPLSFPSGGMSVPGSSGDVIQQPSVQAPSTGGVPLIGRGALLQKAGLMTDGQKEQDKNFADSWQTYANAGGATRTQNAIDIVDQAIASLKSGKLTSGDLMDRMSMNPNGEPSWTGMLANAPILVARNQIASAILPQAKALFGARVTNFDAQSLINSQGLDPLAPPSTNIEKLERLKSSLVAGQNDLQNSGQYFSQNGTLAGYTSPSTSQPSGNSQIPTISSSSALQDARNAIAQGADKGAVMQRLQQNGIDGSGL